jgi:hypothetical protein
VERVLEGRIKKGLVWHFQGSGKTLTMLFAAWKLKKASQLKNPTILLIVDRRTSSRTALDCSRTGRRTAVYRLEERSVQ